MSSKQNLTGNDALEQAEVMLAELDSRIEQVNADRNAANKLLIKLRSARKSLTKALETAQESGLSQKELVPFLAELQAALLNTFVALSRPDESLSKALAREPAYSQTGKRFGVHATAAGVMRAAFSGQVNDIPATLTDALQLAYGEKWVAKTVQVVVDGGFVKQSLEEDPMALSANLRTALHNLKHVATGTHPPGKPGGPAPMLSNLYEAVVRDGVGLDEIWVTLKTWGMFDEKEKQ